MGAAPREFHRRRSGMRARSSGKLLGSAYMEPQSLICAPVCARRATRTDQPLFQARLAAALAGRESFFDRPFYRLVYGDSDTLPG